jgi:Arc/MetJ-type ribon-helix-helix transcriptional regulator
MATRGRPPTGRSSDKPVTVYLPAEDIAALDRLADLRTVRTGKNTSRSDLVREAVKLLLQAERGSNPANTLFTSAST